MAYGHTLGVLDPAATEELNATLLRLEGFHEQIIFDLRSLSDQGRDVTAFKAEADALAQQVSLLRADMMTLAGDTASIAAWRSRADDLDKRLRSVLARTGSDRQSSFELAQLRGLGWALAALGGATAIGFWVWRHRKGARRRR